MRVASAELRRGGLPRHVCTRAGVGLCVHVFWKGGWVQALVVCGKHAGQNGRSYSMRPGCGQRVSVRQAAGAVVSRLAYLWFDARVCSLATPNVCDSLR